MSTITKKVPGGTIMVTGPGSNGLTRSQTKANQRWWREKTALPAHVVCRGPGRFHGGTPSNGLTQAAQRLLNRSFAYRTRGDR